MRLGNSGVIRVFSVEIPLLIKARGGAYYLPGDLSHMALCHDGGLVGEMLLKARKMLTQHGNRVFQAMTY